jgi:hypothetical protein
MSALLDTFFADVPAWKKPEVVPVGNTPEELRIIKLPLEHPEQMRLFQFRVHDGRCCLCGHRDAILVLYGWPCLFGKPTHCPACANVENSARARDKEVDARRERAAQKERAKLGHFTVIGENTDK